MIEDLFRLASVRRVFELVLRYYLGIIKIFKSITLKWWWVGISKATAILPGFNIGAHGSHFVLTDTEMIT